MNDIGLKLSALFVLFLMYGWIPIPLFFLVRFIIKQLIEKAKNKHDAKTEEFIKQNSKLLVDLQALNSRYVFHQLEKTYVYPYKCKSKYEYDRFNFYNSFCNYRNSKIFSEIIRNSQDNQTQLELYNKDYSQIASRIDSDGLGDEYKKAELKLLSDHRINPIVNPKIKLIRSYTSPQGMNRYSSYKEYSIGEVQVAIKAKRDAYAANAKYKATVEYERSLMTPKLRYQVLRRDGYRCCICGTTAKDGAVLHVDHIKPVSKGGKTEMSNLRTLCDRCNLGKGDFYDEDAIN